MKFFQKYIYWILCTGALLMVILFCMTKEEVSKKSLGENPCFYIKTDAGNEQIKIFHGGNDEYYVFLPSYAELEQVNVELTPDMKIMLGDILVSAGMNCEMFELGKAYEYVVNEQLIGTLMFCQSANIATVHIDTATGSMEHIHDNKEYEEDVTVTVYMADGGIDCLNIDGKMKGRGNSTWNYDKKPYALNFLNATDVLGMGAATKWVLLANAREENNLNNKMMFDLASEVGFAWTPENCWVDLYLNGEYNGIYLLTEKVETGENRLQLDVDSGEFLGKIDYESRWNTLNNPFMSDAGRVVEISSPEILTEKEESEIIDSINQMENIILLGRDLTIEKRIDLDSWIYRYLIDEISGNIDADLASSYFYYKNGIFYAGPIWDYDAAFGNENMNQEPHALMAKNAQKSDIDKSLYYEALYQNESFHNRMVEIYSTKFLPILEEMIDEKIDEKAEFIRESSHMNGLRWRAMYDAVKEENTIQTLDEIKIYLKERIAFLNSAWIDGEDYCTLQFENSSGNKYWNISVKRGSCLETTYVDLKDTVWVEKDTGKEIDFSQPINEDMILIQPGSTGFITRDYVTFLSIAALSALFVGFVLVDICGFNVRRRR